MDPKRIVLGYAFFLLGILLTCYQYYHLIDHGPVKPWVRQIILIIINTLAVYIGWLLTYPWHRRGEDEDEHPQSELVHSQRLMSVSLLFCFVTMVGITASIIMVDQDTHVTPDTVQQQPADSMRDLLGQQQVEAEMAAANKDPGFPWERYFIAGLYMVGYGVLGIGPHIVRWLLRTLFSEAAAVGDPLDPEPRRALKKKRKSYPIESMYVLGKIRKKSGRSRKSEAEDTAID